ncbi:MAG: AAA family ATPase, partial [Anaerolineales bacterium]
MTGISRAQGTARLVGRSQELELLWALYLSAREGGSPVALLVGEPGIGKTRLLDEVGTRAAEAGARVLRGGASEEAGMPPYLPFLEALGQAIRSTEENELRRSAGSTASTLSEILPEIIPRLRIPAERHPLPAEQALYRLYEAVGSLVAGLAATRPLVILLDDLHWADSSSLALLSYLSGHRNSPGLFLIGAYREGEAAGSPSFERTLAELSRHRRLHVLRLGPLSEEEIAGLAAAILEARLRPEDAHELFTQSEGNPFFAEEILRGWLESQFLVRSGSEADRDSLWRLTGEARGSLPPSIVGAIRQRLVRLPPEVVDVLRVATILGRTFETSLLAQLQETETEALETLLHPAVQAGLIRLAPPDRCGFSHDKIRETLYAEVSLSRRKRLHESIGLALETRASPQTPGRLADLAFHFSRSDDRRRGSDYSLKAGEDARRTHAPGDAARHYRTALDLLSEDDTRRGETLLGLGDASLAAAEERQALTAFRAALEWFGERGDATSSGRAWYGIGLAHLHLEEMDLAQQALQKALALQEKEPPGGTHLVQTLLSLASLMGLTGGLHAQGLSFARRALAQAEQSGDLRLRSNAGRIAGHLLILENDFETGLSTLRLALELAESQDDPSSAADCSTDLSQAYYWSADIARSIELSHRREEYARRSRQPYQLRFVDSWFALLHTLRGEWREADLRLSQALVHAESLGASSSMGFLRQVRGYLALQRGDAASADHDLEAASQGFHATDPLQHILGVGLLGQAKVRLGRREQAEACLQAQEAYILAASPAPLMHAVIASSVALLAMEGGDTTRAAQYYPLLLSHRGQFHWSLVDRVLGELATALHDEPAARSHFAAATKTAEQQGLRPELGRILMAEARLELDEAHAGSAARARQ